LINHNLYLQDDALTFHRYC